MKSFDNSLPMVLLRTLDAVMPHFRAIYAEHGITDPQWRVLRVLWEGKGISASQLSKRTLIPTPSLVGVLDRLEKRGLLTRQRDASNRRRICVTVTDDGQSLYRTIRPKIDALYQKIMGEIDAREWAQVQTTLEQIEQCAHKQHA